MNKLKFKTNINCGGCVRGVTPALDGNEAIKHWEVDLKNPDRTLTVETEKLSPKEVRTIVEDAGFQAELI